MEIKKDIEKLDNQFETESEVEKEEIDITVWLMDKPFDPTQIDIDTKTLKLEEIINRIKENQIQLNTESYFQRKDNLWDIGKQSSLIESILIRFPLPPFYFDGSDKNNWLVVDGLQRLSSIRNFAVKKDLRLTNLEFLTQLNGMTYDNLGLNLQRIILETEVIVYVINPGTPADVKFNIFKRINTGGLSLNSQEIRHALFQGAPADFVAELSKTKEFIDATAHSIKTERMLDRDFANRFLAFYLFGYESYTPDLETFMSKAMAAVNDFNTAEKESIKSDFIKSMLLNKSVFGDDAFRKIKDKDSSKRKPINKAIFDVFSVLFAKLNEEQGNLIISKKDVLVNKLTLLLNRDEAFLEAVTSSTSDKKRVNYRFTKLEEIINKILNKEL